jgi:hypothetical protein
VKEKWGRLGQVAVGGAGLLTRVGVARWKAWPAVDKCFLKYSIIVDLSVVTLFPSLSAVGSWEEVLLFSMDFTVSQSLRLYNLAWVGWSSESGLVWQLG